MGCLNADQRFDHKFANIHLSGPCNRSCYFCIGQWMLGQDMNNNLTGEIENLDLFITKAISEGITEVNITGTNTDPLMRDGLIGLCLYLRTCGFKTIGLRTNGVRIAVLEDVIPYIDKVSISVTSFDTVLYQKTMGQGTPPDIERILRAADSSNVDVKLNVVLCPETVETGDIFDTMKHAELMGVERINFREPYGQAHIGDPLKMAGRTPDKYVFGNPCYFSAYGVQCTYWDVHYTGVESINLYADGTISEDYAVSLGHSTELGEVHDQQHFKHGRQKAQWVGTKGEK